MNRHRGVAVVCAVALGAVFAGSARAGEGKAIAIYEMILKQYPDFEFAAAARLGLEECKTDAGRR